MPSTFFGLNTAYLGLSAANASLNVSGNNISNVETKGYSRQHTVQSAAEALRVFNSYGCVGAGVDVLAIERYRDEFYDIKYWNNNSNYGQHNAKQYYVKQIENYFRDDDEHMKGFSTVYDELYTTLQELHKDSGTVEVRRSFMGAAEKMTDYFNTQYGNLQNMQEDVNQEIKVLTDRVNGIAAEIVTINKQINIIEVGGGNANELRDKRSVLIDELSEIVDVKVEDQPFIDVKDPKRDTGVSRYIVKIAGGQTLVDDQMSYILNCVARKDYEKVNQSDADGLYDLWWSSNTDNGLEGEFINRFSLNNSAMTGRLKGLFDIRDGNNAEYFHGKCVGVDKRDQEDGNHSFVTISVDKNYLTDINKLTLPPEGRITVGSRELCYDSWTMTTGPDGGTTFEFRLSNDVERNGSTNVAGLVGKDSRIGISVDYQGIPYYMQQMNEWVRCFSKAFNDILTQEYEDNKTIDNYGNPGTRMFLYNVAGDTLQQGDFREYYQENKNSDFTIISSKMDSYYLLSAANFAVSDAMMKDPNLMATHTGNQDEYSKFDIVEELIDLKTNIDKMKFRGSSSASFLQAVLSDVALNGQKANNLSTNFENIGRTIDNQRMSISGVDNDEEALNLVKYQNAYNLSSKMIQVLSEVYDRLILQTGV